MPNVPNVPGVPPLTSYAEQTIAFQLADAAALLGLFAIPQWGIFQNGQPILAAGANADNQVSFDYKQDWPISTYPVEEGQFQTYDRVQLPAEIRCRFAAGGDPTNRQNFLQTINALMNSGTTLFDIVTPEETYIGYSPTHRDFSRAAENVGLIVVDIWMTEIVQTATSTYQNTQQPGYAGQQGSGTSTPYTASATEISAVQNGLAAP